MENINSISISLLILFLSFGFCACKSNPEKKIIGKWELVKMNGEDNPTDEDFYWNFKKDGFVEFKGKEGHILVGKYSLVDSANLILVDFPMEGEIRFNIASVSSKEMVLTVREMFSRDTLYLKK